MSRLRLLDLQLFLIAGARLAVGVPQVLLWDMCDENFHLLALCLCDECGGNVHVAAVCPTLSCLWPVLHSPVLIWNWFLLLHPNHRLQCAFFVGIIKFAFCFLYFCDISDLLHI